jgi:hypothetical protein
MTTVSEDEKEKSSALGASVAPAQSSENQAKLDRRSKEPSENQISSVEFFFAEDKQARNRIYSREVYFDQKTPQQNKKSAEGVISKEEMAVGITTSLEIKSKQSNDEIGDEDESNSAIQGNRSDLGIRDIAKGMFAGEK